MADDRYITITGKGPTWTAKITQLGVELLKGIDDSDSNNHTRFMDSPLRLNKGLGQLEVWTVSEIQERAARLAEDALKI